MPRNDLSVSSGRPSFTNTAEQIGRRNAWEVRVDNGRVPMSDLKSLVRAADRSETYRANWAKFQYRLVERNGDQYLQLRRQGVWSRFKGYFKGAFANDAARRRDERAGAARLILDTFRRGTDQLRYQHYGTAVGRLGDRLTAADPNLRLDARQAQQLAGRVDQALYERGEEEDIMEILRAPDEGSVPLNPARASMSDVAPSGKPQQVVDQGLHLTQPYDPDDEQISAPSNNNLLKYAHSGAGPSASQDSLLSPDNDDANPFEMLQNHGLLMQFMANDDQSPHNSVSSEELNRGTRPNVFQDLLFMQLAGQLKHEDAT